MRNLGDLLRRQREGMENRNGESDIVPLSAVVHGRKYLSRSSAQLDALYRSRRYDSPSPLVAPQQIAQISQS